VAHIRQQSLWVYAIDGSSEAKHCNVLHAQECELLQNELSESKDKLKEATSALLGLQKEYLDLMTEVEGLHAQLNDALNRNHETFSDLAMSR
jgi:GTPase involved in cell partitioning and DNA repair